MNFGLLLLDRLSAFLGAAAVLAFLADEQAVINIINPNATRFFNSFLINPKIAAKLCHMVVKMMKNDTRVPDIVKFKVVS
jgi:site-specific DNA-adenine methylase